MRKHLFDRRKTDPCGYNVAEGDEPTAPGDISSIQRLRVRSTISAFTTDHLDYRLGLGT